VRHEISASNDNVPVIFTPPDEAPAPEQPKPDDVSPSDAPSEAPQVAVVVAASSANVAFAVPVQGSVIVAASPQFVSGPATTHASKPTGNGPVVFSGEGEANGTFPRPDWPLEERKARHTGAVTLHALIAEDGTITEISVRDSSGFGSLDRHVLNHVKRRWQFPPGERRDYYLPFEFRFADK
jgi:protein TonB